MLKQNWNVLNSHGFKDQISKISKSKTVELSIKTNSVYYPPRKLTIFPIEKAVGKMTFLFPLVGYSIGSSRGGYTHTTFAPKNQSRRRFFSVWRDVRRGSVAPGMTMRTLANPSWNPMDVRNLHGIYCTNLYTLEFHHFYHSKNDLYMPKQSHFSKKNVHCLC